MPSKRDVTVSHAGLTAFINDLLSFENKTRHNEVYENGRWVMKTEEIPAEEIFTLIAVRTTEDGKYVVYVEDAILDKLNTRKVRNDKVTEYENL